MKKKNTITKKTATTFSKLMNEGAKKTGAKLVKVKLK